MEMDTLNKLLNAPAESENLEFKAARNQIDTEDLLEYCVALANEGGGHLVLGVTDKPPRQVVGTKAFHSLESRNKIKNRISDTIHIPVEIEECFHESNRALIFEIPSRPVGVPLHYKGAYLMRQGERRVAMSQEKLKSIFNESSEDWFKQMAKECIDPEEVIDLLDTQAYFRLTKLPYPHTREGVLNRLESEGLVIGKQGGKWEITNMGAILLAQDLRRFPMRIARKALRFIIYKGSNKLHTLEDKQDFLGYAVGFENLVNLIHRTAPQNRIVEEVVRQEVKMFPLQAIRELVANALIHQDFTITGTSVIIEMYSDRLEISNPGKPIIDTHRFIDSYKSRNELLADIMRRFGICEEKGSGIDKVFDSVERYQLPAPDFRASETHTTVVLFAYKDFSKMDREDRVRACYQHCCLRYVCTLSMTNQSLRERFKLSDDKTAIVSQIISATKEKGLIKSDNNLESMSTRDARYSPFWV